MTCYLFNRRKQVNRLHHVTRGPSLARPSFPVVPCRNLGGDLGHMQVVTVLPEVASDKHNLKAFKLLGVGRGHPHLLWGSS
jgi:hypothetical protein